MTQIVASGTFVVKISPGGGVDPTIGSMALDKSYSGDLEASGIGQMLAFRTAVEGSAGYVAIERVTGTLNGRSGSFVLQHGGIMDRGKPSLTVQIVPDSGTDALKDLRGTLEIEIADGQHRYRLCYTLQE